MGAYLRIFAQKSAFFMQKDNYMCMKSCINCANYTLYYAYEETPAGKQDLTPCAIRRYIQRGTDADKRAETCELYTEKKKHDSY